MSFNIEIYRKQLFTTIIEIITRVAFTSLSGKFLFDYCELLADRLKLQIYLIIVYYLLLNIKIKKKAIFLIIPLL